MISGYLPTKDKKNLFKTVLKNETPSNSNHSLRAILNWDKEKLIACTYRGIYFVDKKSLTTKLSNFKIKNIGGLINNNLYGLGGLEIRDSIFLGLHGARFVLLNKKEKIAEVISVEENINDLRFFHQDSNKNLWLATNVGLYSYDLIKRKTQSLAPLGSEDELLNSSVNYIYEKKDHLIICSDKGLFSVNHQGKIIEIFSDLEEYGISYILERENDNYWIATKGNGILLWNRSLGTIQQFSKENGLSDDFVYSIHEDEFGYLWLPSNNGLMRFDPKDYSVNIFNEKDGIAYHEFNTYSNHVTDDGRIFLGGLNGITVFDPKDFQYLENQEIPLKIISAKKLSGDKGEFAEIKNTENVEKSIQFNPSDKAISLEFCLFDYNNSFQSKYAYQIENYDNDWNYLTSNKLTINKLPFGEYTLKVKAQGSNGAWSNQILSVPLLVKKPFYLTWQFITAAIALFLFLIFIIVKWRIKNLENDKIALEAIVEERTKKLKRLNQLKDQFFGIIAHDLKNPMLSFRNISKKIKYFKKRGSEADEIRFLEGLDKTAENVNVLLDNLLKWSMVEQANFPYQPQDVSIRFSIDENIALYEEVASQKNILIKNQISEDVNIFADKNSIATIFRNLLSNAIKFSKENSEIHFDAQQDEKELAIKIMDQGIGMSEEKLEKVFNLKNRQSSKGTGGEKGSGLGLVLCKKLVELNKGKINIQSDEGKGTIVTIRFDKKMSKVI